MTAVDAKQILTLSAQADHLALLRQRKRITKAEYIERLNEIRRQCGLQPVDSGHAA